MGIGNTTIKLWQFILMLVILSLLFVAMTGIAVTKEPVNKEYPLYVVWKVYHDGEYFYSIDYIDGKLIKSLEVQADATPLVYSEVDSKMVWESHLNCRGLCGGSENINSVILFLTKDTTIQGAPSEYRSGRITETSTVERIYP